MVSAKHEKQTMASGIHGAIAFEYANAAARNAATGFQDYDKYKLAMQLDDGSIWLLADPTVPTWLNITNTTNPTNPLEFLMPPPNGVDDLPAYTSLLTALKAQGAGTILFRNGVYRSPEGFQLDHDEGITLKGVGTSVSGIGTRLRNTGPRTPRSACIKFVSCNNCFVYDLGVESSVSGPENGILISGDGYTDANYCRVYNVEAYGYESSIPLATSTTSITINTVVNTPVSITISALTVPYTIGTDLLLCSRSGNGFLQGTITSSSGTSITFIPIDAFGVGTYTDWDVLQSMNGIIIASSELCTIDNCTATLCYNSFLMGGVGGIITESCATSAPLGPSFRTRDTSSYVKIFGNAEYNLHYDYTVALIADGAINFEASVSMGDGFLTGEPFILRNIQAGNVYNLNAQSSTTGLSVITIEACQGVSISGIYGGIVSGNFVKNKGLNGNCSITGLFNADNTMETFDSNDFSGFVQWYDYQTAKLNFNFSSFQFITSRFGMNIPSQTINLSNGSNNNISLSSGFQVIIGPTSAFGITGFAPHVDGQVIDFVYAGTEILTLYNNNSGSTVGNRLLSATGADIVYTPIIGGFISFKIMYSNSLNGWLILINN